MTPSLNDGAIPEKQLLVCCSRSRINSSVAEEIRRLLAGPVDWNFLLAQAAAHSVEPLLSRNLSAAAPDAVPPDPLARLKEQVRANSVRSLVLTAELIRVLDCFAAAGIEAFPYKGPVVAVQAYGDLTLREFADIDIVLRQRDVTAANRVLVKLGFAPNFPPIFAPDAAPTLIPGEYDYRDAERRLTVELHTEFTLRHFPVFPDLKELSCRTTLVSISSHEVRTFGPEDTLVFLCVHGSKDFWERLIWITDVAEFVVSHPQLDWERVYRFADSVRARRMLHLGLALADRLFTVLLPDAVNSRIESDSVADSVASLIEGRLLDRAMQPLGLRAAFRYRRSMVPGIFSGFRYALRLATAPAAEDWHAIRLPRALGPLYAALRPFRLWRKYGAPPSSPARPPS